MLDPVPANLSARASQLALEWRWGDLMVLGSTVTSSVNVVVIKVALANSGPLTYGSVRFLLGGVVLCVIARWREGPMPRPRVRDIWLILITAGIGEAISQALFTTTLTFANVDYVAMVQATSPLLIVGWLVWRGREHFGPRVWIGLSLGLAGAALALTAGGGGRTTWLDVLLPLGLPVTSVVYILMLPVLLRRYRAIWLTAILTTVGGLMLAPFGMLEAIGHHPHVTAAWLGLLSYSVFGSVALGFLLYNVAVRILGPARVAAYSYLQPFLSVIAAVLLISEPILPLQILGGVLMLIGVIAGRPQPHKVVDAAGEVKPWPAHQPLGATPAAEAHPCP
jgi:drug/metabolite transporter (DMT)-like permease